MTDNEYNYNYYKNKYYELCAEKNSCDRKIAALESERKAIINEINELEARIKNIKKAIEDMENAIKNEDSLTGKLNDFGKKIEEVASSFKNMVVSSEVTNADLAEIHSSKLQKNENILSGVMSTFKTKIRELNDTLTELENILKNKNIELQNVDSSINNQKSAKSNLAQQCSNCCANMECYKRKMNQELSQY